MARPLHRLRLLSTFRPQTYRAPLPIHIHLQLRSQHHDPKTPVVDSPPPNRPVDDSPASYSQSPDKLSQRVTPAERAAYDHTLKAHVKKQANAPWMRDNADAPPVDKIGSGGQAARGKLLTTPSRMLKLVIPLVGQADSDQDGEDGKRDLEPLALLVHPQQPLSYLERLIQSEVPVIRDKDGKERVPGVWFRAPSAVGEGEEDGEDGGGGSSGQSGGEEGREEQLDEGDEMMVDGKVVKTGKIKIQGDHEIVIEKTKEKKDLDRELRKAHSFSLPDPEQNPADDDPDSFVRWSGSTEIGDFIRDAARAKHFALDIEGAPKPILVGVPSFQDRTYYLRMRLRQKSREMSRAVDIKKECDDLAEKGAKRLATAGGVILVTWWGIVYALTFRTSLGWDVMEPVTYLVGLSTIIGGYGWFLYHNRQVSYKSAMNFTISRRQSALYEQKGFDVNRWSELVEEGNKLRREIKMIAEEYDVTWNEKEDAKSDKVIEALEKERKKKKQEKKDKEEDD